MGGHESASRANAFSARTTTCTPRPARVRPCQRAARRGAARRGTGFRSQMYRFGRSQARRRARAHQQRGDAVAHGGHPLQPPHLRGERLAGGGGRAAEVRARHEAHQQRDRFCLHCARAAARSALAARDARLQCGGGVGGQCSRRHALGGGGWRCLRREWRRSRLRARPAAPHRRGRSQSPPRAAATLSAPGWRGGGASVLQCFSAQGGAASVRAAAVGFRYAKRPLGSVTRGGTWVWRCSTERASRRSAVERAEAAKRRGSVRARSISYANSTTSPAHKDLQARARRGRAQRQPGACAPRVGRAQKRPAARQRRTARAARRGAPGTAPLLPRGRGQWAPCLQRGRSRPTAAAPPAGPAPAPEAGPPSGSAPGARRPFSAQRLRRSLRPLRPGIFGRGAGHLWARRRRGNRGGRKGKRGKGGCRAWRRAAWFAACRRSRFRSFTCVARAPAPAPASAPAPPGGPEGMQEEECCGAKGSRQLK